MNTTTMTEMHHQLAAVTAERDHWKANHDNRVNAAKILMDRTDMPLERIGAYKHYVAALEESQKMRERAESAEAELAKLRKQEPVAWMHDKAGRVDTCHASVKELWIKVGQKQNTQFMREIVPCRVEHYNIPLYAAPVPVPAPATECRGIPGRGCQYLAACNIPCNKCGKVHNAMFSLTPTPFIPDDDTRRNDEAFAAQQAATAPSVPDEWREKLIAEFPLFNDEGLCQEEHHCEWTLQQDRKRLHALLQSADHSEHVLEKVAPDCLTCANLGRVNGLSQESYCDSCIYQGRDWRKNHFVDARKMVDTAKRRCEACAILPCSCK